MALLSSLATTTLSTPVSLPLSTTATTSFSSTTAFTTTTTASTLHSSTTTADALLKLCLLWSVLNKPELSGLSDNHDFPEVPTPPLVCNDYFLYNSANPFSDTFVTTTYPVQKPEASSNGDIRKKIVQKKVAKTDYKYVSSRSLAVIGALGGIIFILLVVALTTCIRHRRELYRNDDSAARERGYARDLLINHIRQFRSAAVERRVASIDPPPSYDEVVKVTPLESSTETLVASSESLNQSSSSILGGLERSVIVSQADEDSCQPPSYQEAIATMTSVSLYPVVDGPLEIPVRTPSADENVKQYDGVTTIHIE